MIMLRAEQFLTRCLCCALQTGAELGISALNRSERHENWQVCCSSLCLSCHLFAPSLLLGDRICLRSLISEMCPDRVWFVLFQACHQGVLYNSYERPASNGHNQIGRATCRERVDQYW